LGVSAPAIKAVEFQACLYLSEKADNTLFIFIQMGGGYSGKNFFKMIKMVCSGQIFPQINFQFQITETYIFNSKLQK
jgi:hypothetical protein